jgi:hypothetical protein
LIRWLLWLACIAGFVWFATTVKLGKRTLWRHVVAIFSTREAKDLADGTRQEARRVAAKLRSEIDRPDAAPLDPVDEKQRRGLDKLIKEKTTKK